VKSHNKLFLDNAKLIIWSWSNANFGKSLTENHFASFASSLAIACEVLSTIPKKATETT